MLAQLDSAQPATGDVVKTFRQDPFGKLDDYPDLQGHYSDWDKWFYQHVMLTLRPYECKSDGFVYIYQRESDVKKLEDGEIKGILLHKIGSTKKSAESRVGQQQKTNKEPYVVVAAYKSKLYKYFEYIAHRYFQQFRVTKGDSIDGKTEWFLVDTQSLMEGMLKLRKGLYYIHSDTLVYSP